jgi:hypothetical protein
VLHALPQIAAALADPADTGGQTHPGAIRGQRNDRPEPALARQVEQQPVKRSRVKPQRRPIPDAPRQPAFHRTKPRRASKDDYHVPHP